MVGVLATITAEISESYLALINMLPPIWQTFLNLFLFSMMALIYSIVIWKFYRFIATKNIFGLNLNKYNTSSHKFTTKLIAGALYFLEYIIVLPFVIFVWFSIFTILLIFLTEKVTVPHLLLISAVIVSVIRMTAYYSEDLSKDIAKLIPFTLLGVALVNQSFFDIEKTVSHLSQIPTFFSEISIYLLFVVILEIVLRFFDFIISLFRLEEKVPKIIEGA